MISFGVVVNVSLRTVQLRDLVFCSTWNEVY